LNDRWIDYRVDDAPDPVPQLGKLLKLHHLYFEKSEPDDVLVIEGEVLTKLQQLMINQAYKLDASGEYDQQTRKALREFVGNENFEDRTDIENGHIDAPVYDFLVDKFSS
jgi:uncharacterized Ntn-hydrolase superfamily protein